MKSLYLLVVFILLIIVCIIEIIEHEAIYICVRFFGAALIIVKYAYIQCVVVSV